ncbi:MAG: hypothetical protein KJZ78_01680 [Bryobacteraceae bacterium]|nr:hypothetical protein [Bryobacteraceae bacterium]
MLIPNFRGKVHCLGLKEHLGEIGLSPNRQAGPDVLELADGPSQVVHIERCKIKLRQFQWDRFHAELGCANGFLQVLDALESDPGGSPDMVVHSLRNGAELAELAERNSPAKAMAENRGNDLAGRFSSAGSRAPNCAEFP